MEMPARVKIAKWALSIKRASRFAPRKRLSPRGLRRKTDVSTTKNGKTSFFCKKSGQKTYRRFSAFPVLWENRARHETG